MENKEKYRQLCKAENTIHIFSRDWWMDAVCGEDKWDAILLEKDGCIIAAMPYFIKERFGFKYITQPKLTPINGIWIKYPEHQRYNKRLSFEKKCINHIIDQLENFDIFSYDQNFHYDFQNWQPFYWKGYRQTTNYTYLIEDLHDIDKVYSNFSKSVKNYIKKASKELIIYTSNDIDNFYRINSMTFERQGLKIPYSLNLLKRIDNNCVKYNARKIYFAKDKNGKIYTAIYIVFDKKSAYLLMSGSNPRYRKNNAKALLIWEAIRDLSSITKKFDFEGSMIERIAEYNRGFGAIQKPYFNISKNMSNSIMFDISKKIYFKIRKAN